MTRGTHRRSPDVRAVASAVPNAHAHGYTADSRNGWFAVVGLWETCRGMSEEVGVLRREIETLLESALRHEKRHLADTERRDQHHLHELERRDELHLEETAARDQAHLQETAARDDAHLREVETRNHLSEQQFDNLRLALESRDLIGQAKGVIMASMRCSPDEAFQLIVKQSQHENRKATEIAAEIVKRVATRSRRPERHT